MSSKLDFITDLEDRAQQADYELKELALECRVSPRHMSRYIRARYQEAARIWLKKLKLQSAEADLAKGKLVKQVAYDLGFSWPCNFSRAFKRLNGVNPNSLRPQTPKVEHRGCPNNADKCCLS